MDGEVSVYGKWKIGPGLFVVGVAPDEILVMFFFCRAQGLTPST